MDIQIKWKILVWTLLLNASQTMNAQVGVRAMSKNMNDKFLISKHSLKTVTLPSGVRLEYAEQGSASGVPVIFLHGYTDSWLSFNQVLPLLPASVHAYAVSLRGHGSSDRPKNGYNPEDFALDIADLISELQIGPAIIVGHSMGATVAQRFALDYPYMTRALVLVASFASFKSNPGISELQSLINKIEDPINAGFVHEFQKSTTFRSLKPGILQTYVHESLKVPAYVWKAVAQGSFMVDYSTELKEVHVPALIIWGDKDSFCPEGDQYILSKAIKKSTLLKYIDIGHAVQWEAPERFAKDILQFIDKVKIDE
jgi:pimeloyl-ACP methyl ester carboxylesterase